MTRKALLVTPRFTREMERWGFPHRCWAAVIYHYWNSLHPQPGIDTGRLCADLVSGEILRKTGFGIRTVALLAAVVGVTAGQPADRRLGRRD